MRTRTTVPLALAILMPALPLAAATSTLDDLVRLVRDAVQQQQSDGDMARALRRLSLKARMDDRTAEELESLAPGPESIAELEELREVSRDKPLPKALPDFPSPPVPSAAELHDVLYEASRKALTYTAGLPDFICTETARRYERLNGGWMLKDTLTLQLTYFEYRETYKLTAQDGRKTSLSYEDVSGAWSKGEFGSMLLDVFSPVSKAVFKWSNWTTLRHRPAYVLSFRIDAGNSTYRLRVVPQRNPVTSTVVGEHGLAYIDRETKEVLRMDSECDSIPGSFPLRGATRALDYGPVEVGGRSFLLPLHAKVEMMVRYGGLQVRNEMEFSDYRKFTGESEITFGDSVDEKPAPAEKK